MERAYEALNEYFGYTEFRDGQKTMIQALLAGQDALGIMPTGAGKSLCFQIPALLFPGITLVVSPLISLMNDQVRALLQSGVAAAYLNRSLTERQYLKALQNARAGKYKIIYVSPERLTTEGFQAFAQSAEISMVAVDEAHCVSQWGQDFRPSYLQVPDFIRSLPQRPVVSAFTATATQTVKEDIIRILELQSPVETTTGFDRKNLYYEVQRPADKQTALLNLVSRYEDTSGIVYCSTRKKVEEVCDLLQRSGHLATRYHAGLSEEERRQNQEDFLFDRQTVMVATNAFGMGIDKSNVHYVIHYNMPKDMESYYQEAGRAGRDGQPADCILLYHGQDVVTNQFLIEHAQENERLDEETQRQVQQKDRERLRKMTFYCHTQDCLRKYILAYFGERHAGFCGNCYNCGDHFERVNITVDAQMILSCVKRTGERFGLSTIVDVLRGAKNEKIFRLGLDKQSTYGLLRQVPEPRLRASVRCLIEKQYLHVSDGDYPVLSLGKNSKQALLGNEPVWLRMEKETKKEPAAKPREMVAVNPGLFQKLRALRGELARKQSVPAYVVFTDASLQEMCRSLPKTEGEFLRIPGVGQKKWEKYGAFFLQAIQEYQPDG
ncbi:MAG: DNA helicase RecQ [Clostridiales bacterium]|jgi:ATP-dependent DNA helicase RecQ|nr:DNA helicase RecQ [Clostridiales bacterium]